MNTSARPPSTVGTVDHTSLMRKAQSVGAKTTALDDLTRTPTQQIVQMMCPQTRILPDGI